MTVLPACEVLFKEWEACIKRHGLRGKLAGHCKPSQEKLEICEFKEVSENTYSNISLTIPNKK